MDEEKRFNLYFGHPTCIYDTAKEDYLIKRIEEHFPNSVHIENPNSMKHSMGYFTYDKLFDDGMRYFTECVLPQTHGGIFVPFRDGKFSAGQVREISHLHNRSRPLWEMSLDGIIQRDLISRFTRDRWLTVDETRKRLDDYMDE